MTNKFNYRVDGRIEWICEHGIGHTIICPYTKETWGFTHTCDGCCSRKKTKLIREVKENGGL